jgi:hypothetical protein
MHVREVHGSEPHVVSQHQHRDSAAAPEPHDADYHGLQLMLDLPTELRCYILELLIIDKHFNVYYTLLEHPEIGDLVRCNFNAQFRAVIQNRYLASQLQQILTTTALLSTHTSNLCTRRQTAEFLTVTLSTRTHPYPRTALPKPSPFSNSTRHACSMRKP